MRKGQHLGEWELLQIVMKTQGAEALLPHRPLALAFERRALERAGSFPTQMQNLLGSLARSFLRDSTTSEAAHPVSGGLWVQVQEGKHCLRAFFSRLWSQGLWSSVRPSTRRTGSTGFPTSGKGEGSSVEVGWGDARCSC